MVIVDRVEEIDQKQPSQRLKQSNTNKIGNLKSFANQAKLNRQSNF
jgi:hypothetical protein